MALTPELPPTGRSLRGALLLALVEVQNLDL
jgi:hypothetical protein